jgi:two-component system phosphate regulon sensor histidine kinase PhoR
MTASVVALALLVVLLALALVHHRHQFGKFRRWVAQPRLADPPEAAGDWGEVFNLLHRHRRETLRRRRQLAQLIVRSRRAAQALPYGVTVLDAELRLDWCNDSARQHFGLDPERDRGAPIVNFMRHPDFVAYLEARDFGEPMQLRLAGELSRTLSLQLVAFDEDAWLLLSQDITGAERLDAMRRDFVANVSHELRTPLTVLSGFLETLQDLKLEPQRMRDYVNLMAPQAGRMQSIIDDLLALSILEHAPPPPEERVALRALLERMRTETEQLSGGRHRISLSIEGEHDLRGAESELSSAFLNLASNAVRYTPAGGEIRLNWCSDVAGGEFSVEDTGIGVEAEHLPRLTERFYRADRGRSRDTGGTGLGLAIVKHALARHQAVLEIESALGKGSVFRARFPAARLLPVLQKVPG